MLVVALTTSISGAFALKVSRIPGKQSPVYDWVKNGSPNYRGTESQARENYDCYGANITCTTGQLVSGSGENPLIIFRS